MKIRYIALLPAIALVVLAGSCGRSKADKERAAQAGTTIIQTGYLEAVDSKSFTLPRMNRFSSLTITGLVEHGSTVQAGDSIIQFDDADIQRHITDLETRLLTQEEALEKLKRSQANTRVAQEATRKSQLANFELAKMSREAARFESESMQRVRELEFQIAQKNFDMQQRKTEFSQIIAEKDLKIRELTLERMRRDLEDVRGLIDGLTIRTPIPGVFEIMYNRSTGALTKVGDKGGSRNKIAIVPDLRWMKVNTYVNEVDILKVKEGQKVAVRLDAMNNIVFDGEISYIGKLCKQRSGSNIKEKVFDVEVKLLQSDERLKPGMTVSCQFL